jgi:hypothetical protein
MNDSKDVVQEEIRQFLLRIRNRITEMELDRARLPGWLKRAQIRIAWIDDSVVAVFEDAPFGPGEDLYVVRGPVGADSVVLLNIGNLTPEGASLRARSDVDRLTVIQGTLNAGGRTVIKLTASRPALFNCGYAGYHSPIALFNLFLQHTPFGADAGPFVARFVPFALYVHSEDLSHTTAIWEPAFAVLDDTLRAIHDSASGDFYENRQMRAATLEVLKKSSVIVLGSYASPHDEELIQVRDHLKSLGYEAELILDLPDTADMSNEDKVRFWTTAARFCVMVDRAPSGHIAEYVILREQQSIVALLRPRGDRSTYMIGDEHLVNVNHIRLFEFQGTPLSALGEVVQWAEFIAQERAEAYGGVYPWRDGPDR